MRIFHLFILSFIAALAVVSVGCHRHGEAWNDLERADSIIEDFPDSALNILDSIPADRLKGAEERARHALLLSMALDKTYKDLTTFDTLQPAIDYYLSHGTADEKLRTYYYQARIFQNRHEDEKAMKTILYAKDLKPQITDSLVYARLLVFQGYLFVKQYNPEEFINNNLESASLYKALNKPKQELKSYERVLNGFLLLNDYESFKNTLIIYDSILNNRGIPPSSSLYTLKLRFYNDLKDTTQIRELLKEVSYLEPNMDMTLEVAESFTLIGETDSVKKYLDQVDVYPTLLDSLKVDAMLVGILEREGKYKEALFQYKSYSEKLSTHLDNLLKSGVIFEEQKHELEIENLMALRRKDHIILVCVSVVFLLVIIGVILMYRINVSHSKRVLAEKEQERLFQEKEIAVLERDKESLHATNLRIEKEHLESQQREFELESRHLKSEKRRLESERDNLIQLLQRQSDLSLPLRDVVKLGLDMLNKVLLKEFAKNEKHTKQYNDWIAKIREDKNSFMNTTRLVFTATHPEFIHSLERRGLTKDEINYVCLFALGFNGKEAGEFLEDRSHYIKSSDLRKKLKLPEKETNLSIYIRRLLDE